MASAWVALLPVGHAGKEELLLPEDIDNGGSGPTFCFLGVVGNISIDLLLMGQSPHACHTHRPALVLRSLAQG